LQNYEANAMDMLGVIVILLVGCLVVAIVCLGLVIYMFIKLRRTGWKKMRADDDSSSPPDKPPSSTE